MRMEIMRNARIAGDFFNVVSLAEKYTWGLGEEGEWRVHRNVSPVQSYDPSTGSG